MGCLEGLYITQHLLNCVNNPATTGLLHGSLRLTLTLPATSTPTWLKARPSQTVTRDEVGRFTRPDAHRRTFRT
jgi:hypothetical protein